MMASRSRGGAECLATVTGSGRAGTATGTGPAAAARSGRSARRWRDRPDPQCVCGTRSARTRKRREHLEGARAIPGAAASLRRGLKETLTVTRRGVRGPLPKTVCSTNPMASMVAIVREHASTVKRWRAGKMVWPWAAAGRQCARAQSDASTAPASGPDSLPHSKPPLPRRRKDWTAVSQPDLP